MDKGLVIVVGVLVAIAVGLVVTDDNVDSSHIFKIDDLDKVCLTDGSTVPDYFTVTCETHYEGDEMSYDSTDVISVLETSSSGEITSNDQKSVTTYTHEESMTLSDFFSEYIPLYELPESVIWGTTETELDGVPVVIYTLNGTYTDSPYTYEYDYLEVYLDINTGEPVKFTGNLTYKVALTDVTYCSYISEDSISDYFTYNSINQTRFPPVIDGSTATFTLNGTIEGKGKYILTFADDFKISYNTITRTMISCDDLSKVTVGLTQDQRYLSAVDLYRQCGEGDSVTKVYPEGDADPSKDKVVFCLSGLVVSGTYTLNCAETYVTFENGLLTAFEGAMTAITSPSARGISDIYTAEGIVGYDLSESTVYGSDDASEKSVLFGDNLWKQVSKAYVNYYVEKKNVNVHSENTTRSIQKYFVSGSYTDDDGVTTSYAGTYYYVFKGVVIKEHIEAKIYDSEGGSSGYTKDSTYSFSLSG